MRIGKSLASCLSFPLGDRYRYAAGLDTAPKAGAYSTGGADKPSYLNYIESMT